MPRIRSRLTFANVVSVLALFVALGGSATAAVVITGKNVKNSSLTGADVENSSLGSADVKDGDLLAKDFKPGQLVSGAPGPIGPQGAQGPKGDTGAKGDTGPSTGPAGGDLTGSYPDPTLAATPAARAYWSGTDACGIDISNNTEVRLGWSQQSFDYQDGTADEMFTGSCAPTSAKMTAPRDGVYAVSAGLVWEANAAGARELKLKRNGSTLVASAREAAAPTGLTIQNVSGVVRMVKGDYVEAYAAQDSGATRQLDDFDSQNNFLAMYWVSP